MNVTITGPRSVGKSIISKIVAKKLNLKYVSSDEIGEHALKNEGGLDKAIKSGVIGKFIQEGAYNLIREQYQKENFVFDLSGGSISSRKNSEASKKARETAKKNSVIVGLLPSKNAKESIKFLFEREKERHHFKNMDRKELRAKVEDDYKQFPPILKELCDLVVYVQNKTKEQIADEIVLRLQQK